MTKLRGHTIQQWFTDFVDALQETHTDKAAAEPPTGSGCRGAGCASTNACMGPAGGRTGVTAIVTGLLFFLSIFIAPAVGAIPDFATAPALILVGALMLAGIGTIEWDEPRFAIPAFLTIISIPLTYSIATGLSARTRSPHKECTCHRNA